MNFVTPSLLTVGCLALIACGGDDHVHAEAGPSGPKHVHVGGEADPVTKSTGTHDHQHDHPQSEGVDPHSVSGNAQTQVQAVGPYMVGVQPYGGKNPGTEAHIDLTVTGGPTPQAVRLWIGSSEDGRGSEKVLAKLNAEGKAHVHVRAPSPMPDPAMIWVSVQNAEGTDTVSFKFLEDNH